MTNDSYRQLVLTPAQLQWQPDNYQGWITRLQTLGFIAEPVDADQSARYLTGAHFFQYCSFMGCSPAVSFEPDSPGKIHWGNFVFIHLPQVPAEPRWLVDRQLAKPACPVCHKRNRDWLTALRNEAKQIECQHCAAVSPLCAWEWFDGGGCARVIISIVNVYPREAIPTDNFLQLLAQISGVAWRYFYAHDPL